MIIKSDVDFHKEDYGVPSVSDTQRLHIVKVFRCVPCKYILQRNQVWKDRDGKYHCNMCHGIVEDITNRTTGHDFLEILAL